MADQYNFDELDVIMRAIEAMDDVDRMLSVLIEKGTEVANTLGSKKLQKDIDTLMELKPAIVNAIDSISGTSTDGEGGFAGLTMRGYVKSAKELDAIVNG